MVKKPVLTNFDNLIYCIDQKNMVNERNLCNCLGIIMLIILIFILWIKYKNKSRL